MIGLFLLQIFAVIVAYLERGYFAIGGEYLIIPLLYTLKILYNSFPKNIKEWVLSD